MAISYTYENNIIWIAIQGTPGAKKIIKTLHCAFKDKRFIPGSTSIIYNLTLLNRQLICPEKDRKIIPIFFDYYDHMGINIEEEIKIKVELFD